MTKTGLFASLPRRQDITDLYFAVGDDDTVNQDPLPVARAVRSSRSNGTAPLAHFADPLVPPFVSAVFLACPDIVLNRYGVAGTLPYTQCRPSKPGSTDPVAAPNWPAHDVVLAAAPAALAAASVRPALSPALGHLLGVRQHLTKILPDQLIQAFCRAQSGWSPWTVNRNNVSNVEMYRSERVPHSRFVALNSRRVARVQKNEETPEDSPLTSSAAGSKMKLS